MALSFSCLRMLKPTFLRGAPCQRQARCLQRAPRLPARSLRCVRALQTPESPPAEAQSQAPVTSHNTVPANPADDSIQAKAAGFLNAIGKHRRVIAVVVAVLDVAFIWVAIKGVKFFFWDQQ